MAETSPSTPPDNSRQSLTDAIALFEGILQGQPEDRVALEALSMAYEQTGDVARSRATLIRLAHVLVRLREREPAAAVAKRLEGFVDEDFEALEALRSIETLLAASAEERPAAGAGPTPAEAAGGEAPPAPDTPSEVVIRQQVISREMALAWELLEAEQLSQDDYATLVGELTNMGADPERQTISLLHAIVGHKEAALAAVLAFLAKRSGRPLLPLAGFTPQLAAGRGLAPGYGQRIGAMPFDFIGDEVMVAVLNPLDEALLKELGQRLGRRCHAYLTSPADFDALCQRLQDLAAAERINMDGQDGQDGRGG